jgi:hypothetical protein
MKIPHGFNTCITIVVVDFALEDTMCLLTSSVCSIRDYLTLNRDTLEYSFYILAALVYYLESKIISTWIAHLHLYLFILSMTENS